MANLFLDANIYIDLIKRRNNTSIEDFEEHVLFISPLSIHIINYLYKYKIPSHELTASQAYFTIVPTTEEIVSLALNGPTSDFEDNIQLYSALEAECDTFITNDKKLLQIRIFGKMHILSKL